MILCPECSGPHMEGHPAGILVFRHVPNGCSLGEAQDSCHVADVDALADPLGPVEFDRPPTPAERTLIDALGPPAA